MPNWVQIRHAAGGSSLLHRRALVLMLPTTFLTSLMARDTTDLPGFVGWSVANILALLGCWFWVECVDRTLFRHKAVRPIAFGWVATFGASLGALKGTLTDAAGYVVGVGEAVGVATAWRSVSNAIIGAALIPLLAVAHVAVKRYHSEYQLMVAQTLPTVGMMSAQSKAALITFANDARDTLRQAAPSEAAERIMGLIDERLRPYTHQLWAQTETPPERLNLRSLLRITLAHGPLPMVSIATVYALSVWPVSIELAGLWVGTARTVIAGVVLYGTVTLARLILPDTAGMMSAVLHFGVTVAIATSLQILQWDYLFGGMPRPSTIGLWGTVAVWLAILMLFGGVVSAAVRARALVREAVLHAVGPDGLRAIAIKDYDRLVAQRLASRLHADVQGQMLAAARRIQAHHDTPKIVETDGVDVTVTDDGVGPRNGPFGLGSTFFASVSGGNWSLTPSESGGSVLHVTLIA